MTFSALMMRGTLCIGFMALCCPIRDAGAQTMTTYTYDALGRLVKSRHAGGRNDNVEVTQQFDPADNRTQQVVTGQSQRAGVVVVVPLNGFTVIPIRE